MAPRFLHTGLQLIEVPLLFRIKYRFDARGPLHQVNMRCSGRIFDNRSNYHA